MMQHISRSTLPTNLMTADEVAQCGCFVSPDKLREWADALLIPHYRVDGGEPLFKATEVKNWLAQNKLTRHDGCGSLKVQVINSMPLAIDRPAELSTLSGLREIDYVGIPGIYFLCKHGQIVYVGQSKSNYMGRIYTHASDPRKDFDQVFFLPSPVGELDYLESKFIHALRPKHNGRQGKAGNYLVAPLRPEEVEDFERSRNVASGRDSS